MQHTRNLMSLVALGLIALHTPPVAAAEGDDLLAQGVALRAEGRDAEALELFLAAYAQEPSARVAAQVGLACQALGRWVDAERYLEQAVAERDDPWIRKHGAPLRRALKTIGEHLGALQVVGSPAGAEVRFGGRLVGRLPMDAPVRVVAERAALEVSAPGYEPITRSLDVKVAVTSLERVSLTVAQAASTEDPFERARLEALRAEEGAESPEVATARLARLREARASWRPLVGLGAGFAMPSRAVRSFDTPDAAEYHLPDGPGPHLQLDVGARGSLGSTLDLQAAASLGWFAASLDDGQEGTFVTLEATAALQWRPLGEVTAWLLHAGLGFGVWLGSGYAGGEASSASDTDAPFAIDLGTGLRFGDAEGWALSLIVPLRVSLSDEGLGGDTLTIGLSLRLAYAF